MNSLILILKQRTTLFKAEKLDDSPLLKNFRICFLQTFLVQDRFEWQATPSSLIHHRNVSFLRLLLGVVQAPVAERFVRRNVADSHHPTFDHPCRTFLPMLLYHAMNGPFERRNPRDLASAHHLELAVAVVGTLERCWTRVTVKQTSGSERTRREFSNTDRLYYQSIS